MASSQNISHVLETERLVLRPFREEDLGLIQTLYGDAQLLRFTPFDTMTPELARAHLERIIRDWDQLPLRSMEFAMVRKPEAAEEEKIGRCHILIDPETETGMIGWLIRREYQGQHFALESGKALIRCCFEALGLHRANAVCHPDNPASRRVLERLGMRQEAHYIRKCRYTKNGSVSWEDEVEYALLASEYALPSC